MKHDHPRERFLGLTKTTAAILFIVVGLSSLNIFGFLLVRNINENAHSIARNKAALGYTCDTTTILSGLVSFVIGQDKAALGVQHRFTKDQRKAIRRTIDKFTAAQTKLAANGACRAIDGH